MYTIEHTIATLNVDVRDPGTLVHVAQGTIGGCLSCWRIAKGNYMTLRLAVHSVVVRTRGEPLETATAAMRIVRDFDRDLAVTRVATLESIVRDDLVPDRVLSGMMLGFAVAAMVISTIGLYGVISYCVAQRMREFARPERAIETDIRMVTATTSALDNPAPPRSTTPPCA